MMWIWVLISIMPAVVIAFGYYNDIDRSPEPPADGGFESSDGIDFWENDR